MSNPRLTAQIAGAGADTDRIHWNRAKPRGWAPGRTRPG
jgi:hypothetical protein